MQLNRNFQRGFTLIEMIVVMVITGILGGMIAIFISGPVQGYLDSARRAEITDIADTAMGRITRDLRTALPNSVRITQVGSAYYLEFIPTKGGGRYRSAQDCSSTCTGDILDFTLASDNSFDVLGQPIAANAGDYLVVYNLGTPTGNCSTGLDAYEGYNRRTIVSGGSNITFTPTTCPFPSNNSPGHHFQVTTAPVSYVCNPAAGTLTRYASYGWFATQPTSTLSGGNLLATNVSACNFPNPVAGIVTLYLTITESGESISLYDTANVVNVP
jgi:MSHA biogenesis protein MshO